MSKINTQIKNLTIGLSSYLRSLFKTWGNLELLDHYKEALESRGLFEDVAPSKINVIKRCFAGEFKRRAMYVSIL